MRWWFGVIPLEGQLLRSSWRGWHRHSPQPPRLLHPLHHHHHLLHHPLLLSLPPLTPWFWSPPSHPLPTSCGSSTSSTDGCPSEDSSSLAEASTRCCTTASGAAYAFPSSRSRAGCTCSCCTAPGTPSCRTAWPKQCTMWPKDSDNRPWSCRHPSPPPLPPPLPPHRHRHHYRPHHPMACARFTSSSGGQVRDPKTMKDNTSSSSMAPTTSTSIVNRAMLSTTPTATTSSKRSASQRRQA
mmetsp:Transcript_7386/g.14460  ORF Transcript_7386/g.14460 Transcript_7386/m.14460 type:complete len:240 (-) Transcript_7386:188-907(-)